MTTVESDVDADSERVSNVLVAVRVRPAKPNARTTLSIDGNAIRLRAANFRFDHVADDNASQAALFTACGAALVDALLDGFNGCIFAYGQVCMLLLRFVLLLLSLF